MLHFCATPNQLIECVNQWINLPFSVWGPLIGFWIGHTTHAQSHRLTIARNSQIILNALQIFDPHTIVGQPSTFACSKSGAGCWRQLYDFLHALNLHLFAKSDFCRRPLFIFALFRDLLKWFRDTYCWLYYEVAEKFKHFIYCLWHCHCHCDSWHELCACVWRTCRFWPIMVIHANECWLFAEDPCKNDPKKCEKDIQIQYSVKRGISVPQITDNDSVHHPKMRNNGQREQIHWAWAEISLNGFQHMLRSANYAMAWHDCHRPQSN